MADSVRNASPLSSSPGRSERPQQWPWESRFSRRTSSVLSAAASPPSGLQTAWDPATSRPISSSSSSFSASASSSWQSNATPRQPAMGLQDEGGTRQWTFMGFEWNVREVHKLRDFVENGEDDSEQADEFEILKSSPMIGDDKFKLEIARAAPVESGGIPDTKPQSLSLSITSLVLDFAHNYELNASIMCGIKCQDDRVGARTDWMWELWQNDWVFRRDCEVWECTLPSLSALLENTRIRETDSFIICIQIHCPQGPFFPQQPTAYYVPKDLLDGLEASLDNPNTGDVRFVCLERMPPEPELPASPSSDNTSTFSQSFSTQTTARKRIIYAHSDILTRRSDYFATMLSSSFVETKLIPGERKLFTIVVEEADFETMYWLLKYCYANWLHFKDHDDPRIAVEGIGAGWSARWLSARGGEWDWKTFAKISGDDSTVADTKSATSADSIVQDAPTTGKSKAFAADPVVARSPQQTARTPSKVVSNNASSSRQPPSVSAPRRSTQPSTPGSSAMSGVARTKPVPLTPASGPYTPTGHYPISPRTQRSHQSLSAPDPHLHPTPAPPPASALSVYQVAHRYAMPTLAALALEHMMSTITPHSSFGLLLASSVWEDLRALVEDYVVEKWEEVSVSEEFEQCCQEISAGEWGPEGGKTLMALFRRLRSPSAMGYVRA
ncbi:hypothetical protein FB45DRAFT_827834 [Roridomyces roridus]|uniref:BTB domain-containing protein n=1 Tax=Roridomyces roridus TaxID=1738132 RepID=A0AAD7C5C2_9AGAR|nr:hypothetical protein FB45DRAFT_827834 [Roridomyces roridus]